MPEEGNRDPSCKLTLLKWVSLLLEYNTKFSKEDLQVNDQALKSGQRIFSVYLLSEELQYVHRDTKIWIIAEADRSATTVLFPSDY